MRIAVLATGGKDSILALHRVLGEGHEVEYLVTMMPQRDDSWMFHYPNIGLMDLVAEAVGIPLAKAETSGTKESELEDLKRLLGTLHVEGVVSGAIASTYQKTRIDQICTQLGLESLTPLWHEEPLDLLNEIVRLRFSVTITAVFAYGFDESWLGRKMDQTAIADLVSLNRKHGISLVGEGGEYETLVLDAPLYKRRIAIMEAEKTWKDQNGLFRIVKAELEGKS